MVAALADFTQTIDLATLRVGSSDIQLVKFGTAEARITAALRTDGILRGLGGLLAGSFTTSQRNAISSPAKGLIVFNTDTNRYEVNLGTTGTPNWQPMTPSALDPPVTVYAAGPMTGGTYQLAAPAAGTYIVEWGAGLANSLSQGGSATITCNKAGGVAKYADFGGGGPMVRGGISFTGGENAVFTVSATNFSLEHLWAKLIRTA